MIVYCFDHSLSPKLAFVMRYLLPDPEDEPIVVPHDITHVSEIEGIPPGAPVDALIPKLAECGHTLVTCLTPSKRKLVNQALADAGVRVVYLAPGYVTSDEFSRAARLLENWAKIVKGSYRLKAGNAVMVQLNGVVEDA